MNQEWKDKWLTALRSGRYKQGRGNLKTRYGNYCCLGVLADIVDKDAWRKPINGNASWTIDGRSGNLPDYIINKVGLSFSDTCILMRKNDDARWNFNKIADLIEDTL